MNKTVQGAMSFDPLAALSEEQCDRLADYERLLVQFNDKVNLISRPSEARVREEHTLHSLALAWKSFPDAASVVDFGTGGGLPAIPLAIAFPGVQFTAVDANGKKVRAVRAMARRLGLDNLSVWKGRAERWPGAASYSVTRATASLRALWRWHRRVAEPLEAPAGEAEWPPGLLALKGGDLADERALLEAAFPSVQIEMHPLRPLLGRDFFEGKCIIAVQQRDE